MFKRRPHHGVAGECVGAERARASAVPQRVLLSGRRSAPVRRLNVKHRRVARNDPRSRRSPSPDLSRVQAGGVEQSVRPRPDPDETLAERESALDLDGGAQTSGRIAEHGRRDICGEPHPGAEIDVHVPCETVVVGNHLEPGGDEFGEDTDRCAHAVGHRSSGHVLQQELFPLHQPGHSDAHVAIRSSAHRKAQPTSLQRQAALVGPIQRAVAELEHPLVACLAHQFEPCRIGERSERGSDTPHSHAPVAQLLVEPIEAEACPPDALQPRTNRDSTAVGIIAIDDSDPPAGTEEVLLDQSHSPGQGISGGVGVDDDLSCPTVGGSQQHLHLVTDPYGVDGYVTEQAALSEIPQCLLDQRGIVRLALVEQ